MSYTFIDATGATQTADSSVVSGIIQRPIVNIGSIIGDMQVKVNMPSSSVVAYQLAGSIIGVVPTSGSVVGTYSEDAPHTPGDSGLAVWGVRNDTMASVTSTDGDYSQFTVGPMGENIVANSPITKWVQAQTSVMYGTSVLVLAAQGASVFSYVTGVQIANDSPTYSRVTFTVGLGGTSSILGFIPAPANSGAIVTLPNAWKTAANAGISASISGVSSIYVTLEGFISKT